MTATTTTRPMEAFKERMAELREKTGMSLQDVAVIAGVQRTTVWKTEAGEGYLPKGSTLTSILAALGVKDPSKTHREIVALWTNAKMPDSVINTDALNKGREKSADRTSAEVDKAISLMGELSLDDLRHVTRAMQRPEVLEGLKVLNGLYELE